MKILTLNELNKVTGGKYDAFPIDATPERNAFAFIGGHVNNFLADHIGLDMTQNTLTGNKLLGVAPSLFFAFLIIGVM